MDGLGVRRDRRCPGPPEHAHPLHRPLTGLRQCSGLPGQHRPSGSLGVDGVGLAPPSRAGLVRLVDFEDRKPRGQQRPAQRCPAGAGALHPGPAQCPETSSPGEQLPVTSSGRREAGRAQDYTQHADHRGEMNIFVGVPTNKDLLGIGVGLARLGYRGHPGHARSSFCSRERMAIAGPAGRSGL